MTYVTNYTLTTVRKLIFSAGHKINRHSCRNVYPPMIQVRIPTDWYLPTNMGINANTPKNNSNGELWFSMSSFQLDNTGALTFPHLNYYYSCIQYLIQIIPVNLLYSIYLQFICSRVIEQIFGAHSFQFCVNRRIGNTKNREVQFLHKYIITTRHMNFRIELIKFIYTLWRKCLWIFDEIIENIDGFRRNHRRKPQWMVLILLILS